MRILWHHRALLICLALLATTCGCTHTGYATFANTRKLLESEALGVTKVGFAPFVGAVDMVATPLTTYLDAAQAPRDEGHVYVSYLGMQTIVRAEMNPLYKLLAGFMILPVDTVWFPVGGTIDTIYAVNADAPEKEEIPEDGTREERWGNTYSRR